MPHTYHPGHFPLIIFILPGMDKFIKADLGLAVLYMDKPVHAYFDGAVAGDGVHFHGAWYQFAP